MTALPPVGIRWTLGNVSDRGYEALRLSVWGAHRIFGEAAVYAICSNNIVEAEARERVGRLPVDVSWRDATSDLPPFLAECFDRDLAEGVAWKLAPLRLFPDRWELSLDNDCILWELPGALRRWFELGDAAQCVLAEDVKACFGQFAEFCGERPCNAGIRGLSPGFDLEASLRGVLDEKSRRSGAPVLMSAELDEQGLQTAALSQQRAPLLVSIDEVTICSPFWPHLPHLGRCGAHFVGLNARHLPFHHYDRPADAWMTEHWLRLRDALYEKTGCPRPARAESA
jgi:hypothetical protein